MKKDYLFNESNSPEVFEFNDRVASVFDDMVSRSVPLYMHLQAATSQLTKRYLKNGEVILDIGCSTATTLIQISKDLDIDAKLIGIDSSKAMLDKAKDKLIEHKLDKKINLLHCDVEKIIREPDLIPRPKIIIMNYTLQFIQPAGRQNIVKGLFDLLQPGGILILSEKISHESDEINQTMIDIYHNFKKINGYSELEISKKRDAMENVLIPFTAKQNIELFNNAGFNEIAPIFQWYSFVTFLGIKR